MVEMHQNGIIHRDIKLENIFFTSRFDQIATKLGDFDISTFQNSHEEPYLCGSPGYIAPEVFESLIHDEKSDIYSLGIVLFSIIFGYFPFKTEEVVKLYLEGKPHKVRLNLRNLEEYSPEFTELLLSMLVKDPQKRPSAQDILDSRWLHKFCAPFYGYSRLDTSELGDEDDGFYLKEKNKNIESIRGYTFTKVFSSGSTISTKIYKQPAFSLERELVENTANKEQLLLAFAKNPLHETKTSLQYDSPKSAL
eukprot:TRINITY_DN6546_c0_g1_i1.p1 TRINITY_DN6546_c0_g1~~TRINITY_DN6546_c0_g1_i1.p1  ORF type:complete len:251 (+),score=33.22 TRINITY_DN6546_c0_g1_i1:195-947(+)